MVSSKIKRFRPTLNYCYYNPEFQHEIPQQILEKKLHLVVATIENNVIIIKGESFIYLYTINRFVLNTLIRH